MDKEVLVVEISGKRPGDKNARPTEKMNIKYDKLIISNNSTDYVTDWQIVNVPDDFVEFYKEKYKNSDNAWYAPMNRSYAIKYAKEKGYKYLVQLDDNIVMLQIAYSLKEKNKNYIFKKEYRSTSISGDDSDMINDFINVLIKLLQNTNAGISGCGMSGASAPGEQFLSERYNYSLFALDLSKIPDNFHGDFEDDIEFRLKLTQMNIPSIQICPFMYGKTGQQINKDLTGCRLEYLKAGVKRGEHMRKLYGDVYSAGMSNYSNRVGKQEITEQKYFKHKLKPIKLGITIKNKDEIEKNILKIFKKYSNFKENIFYIKEEKNKSKK